MGFMTLDREPFTDNHKEVLWVFLIYGWRISCFALWRIKRSAQGYSTFSSFCFWGFCKSTLKSLYLLDSFKANYFELYWIFCFYFVFGKDLGQIWEFFGELDLIDASPVNYAKEERIYAKEELQGTSN